MMAFLGLALILGGLIAIGMALGVPVAKMSTRGTTRKPPSSGFCLGLPLGVLMMWMGLTCWHNLPDPDSGHHPDTDYTIGETK